MAIEDGDEVTFDYVARTADGTVFDTSQESVAEETGLVEEQDKASYSSLTVTVGTGELIAGLDEGIVGLEEGDRETFTIPPEQGYGEWTEDKTVEYSPGAFMGMLEGEDPEVGQHVKIQDGQHGKVVEVSEETVRIDFNHELAGETLEFEIEILDVS
ncbi:peptidylprolyl isomerase [Haloarculaceae archaeon H-GB2-1]|nr:peptidylprolyl isomerase [Haloarculaceae archaeon H-GB1-1]MEA5408490.1 peptidylprolyl isomerase [Haloarculaceae archaeon H-GB2-1]